VIWLVSRRNGEKKKWVSGQRGSRVNETNRDCPIGATKGVTDYTGMKAKEMTSPPAIIRTGRGWENREKLRPGNLQKRG